MESNQATGNMGGGGNTPRPYSALGMTALEALGVVAVVLVLIPTIVIGNSQSISEPSGPQVVLILLFAIGYALSLTMIGVMAEKGKKRKLLLIGIFVPYIVVPYLIIKASASYRRASEMKPARQLHSTWQQCQALAPLPRIGVVLGAIVSACLLITVAAVGSAVDVGLASSPATAATATSQSQTSVDVSPTDTDAVPTISPTVVPTNTATPTPTVVPSSSPLAQYAVLGGSETAFEAKYGAPDSGSSAPMYVFGANHFLNVIVGQGANGQIGMAVTGITAGSPDGTPMDPTTAREYCQSYAPSDAKYVKQIPYTDSNGVEGIDYVYVSNKLSQVFSAKDFFDKNGNAVQPGTFDDQLLYSSPNDSSSIDSCSLALGATQY